MAGRAKATGNGRIGFADRAGRATPRAAARLGHSAAIPLRDGVRWYAVRVRPQQRQIMAPRYRGEPVDAPFMVEHWLNLRGFETFTPRRRVFRFVNGTGKRKQEKVARAFPAFPGWMFVAIGEGQWRDLFDCPGVSGVAGIDGVPMPVRARAIRILARDLGVQLVAPERERHMPTYKEYAPGQAVRVTAGPFVDHALTVIDVKGPTARVLLHLFGRESEVQVPSMMLEAA